MCVWPTARGQGPRRSAGSRAGPRGLPSPEPPPAPAQAWTVPAAHTRRLLFSLIPSGYWKRRLHPARPLPPQVWPGASRLWPLLQAWRSPGVPPAGTCTCCLSRTLPGSRAAPCRTGAAAQAPRARHGHGARLSAPAGRYAGPARTPARLATGAAAPHGLAGRAVLTLGKDPGPQPHGACGQGGGRADAAGATDPGWRPC